MERKENKVILKTASLALAVMIAMMSGQGAKAKEGQNVRIKQLREICTTISPTPTPSTSPSPTPTPTIEPTPIEEDIVLISRYDDNHNIDEVVDLVNGVMVYEFLLDGEEAVALVYSVDRTPEDEGIYCELFSYQKLFILHRSNGFEILEGVGLFEGRELEFIGWYGLEEYFEKILKIKVNWKEIRKGKFIDLRELVESTSLIDNYLLLPHAYDNEAKREYFKSQNQSENQHNAAVKKKTWFD